MSDSLMSSPVLPYFYQHDGSGIILRSRDNGGRCNEETVEKERFASRLRWAPNQVFLLLFLS